MRMNKSILLFVNDSRNIKLLNELDKLGVWPNPITVNPNQTLFEGKTFVITGANSGIGFSAAI